MYLYNVTTEIKHGNMENGSNKHEHSENNLECFRLNIQIIDTENIKGIFTRIRFYLVLIIFLLNYKFILEIEDFFAFMMTFNL